MPDFILTSGAVVLCAHGGSATPGKASARVLAMGQPVVTLNDAYVIAGCPLPAPSGPCVSGQFISGASRVLVEGQPVALQGGSSICSPTGTPMLVTTTQQRVTAG